MGWFKKHKILSVILAFVLIAVIASAAGGDKSKENGNSSSGSKQSSESKAYKFNDRADKQSKDVEVLPGEAATVGDVKMTVSNVEYKMNLGDYQKADTGKTYVTASVTLENTSNKTQSYNALNFRIQTVSGQVLDTAFSTVPSPLNSGDIVSGGKATGTIVFQVPDEEGHQYVIWKPNPYNAARAIVQVK